MTTYPVKLSTISGNIELDMTAVTTDYKGEATFNVAGLREGEYKVYVNDTNIGKLKSSLSGKISFSIELDAGETAKVQIVK